MKQFLQYRSAGFAFTGYDMPGCVEDGAWMIRENSSVAVVVAAVVALSFLNILHILYEGVFQDRAISRRVGPKQHQ